MRRPGLALAAALLSAAVLPASAAPKRGIVLVQEAEGVLRHGPTGIALPASLGSLRRAATVPGNPAIIVYAGRGAEAAGAPTAGIALGRVRSAPGVARMRDGSRIEAAVSAPSEILSEGGFAWPGHPRAQTFRGAYAVGTLRKDFWHAWDGGYAITLWVVTIRAEPAQIEGISAGVAGLFGGTPAKSLTNDQGGNEHP